MSTSLLVCESARVQPWARLRDYVELTRPKIAVLELLTVAAAACVASWNAPPAWLLVNALFGTALVAASASAWNQWLERGSDLRMPRTADRPLPGGRMTGVEVVAFGTATGLAGVAWLAGAVNLLTAFLALLTWFLYVGVYTPLKRRTSLNTAIGAVAGAMPVLLGWAAVGASLNAAAWALFAIVFLWQFPHFMAIAWIYRRDYAAAGMRMLPVVDPTGHTAGIQALSSALVLVPISLLPAVELFAGAAYLAWALLLGLGLLACSAVFSAWRTEPTARLLLRASLVYLPALLLMLMLSIPRV